MSEPSSSPDPLVDEDCRRRFEQHRLGGGDEDLAQFLPPADHPAYAGTLEELVCIDLEVRWKAWGTADEEEASPDLAPPDLTDYRERFPSLLEPEATHRLEREQAWLATQHRRGGTADVGVSVGRYRLEERVGRGAFAEVWRARDETLRRDVALKIARPELAGDPLVVARLVREARSAAQLHHPNIVPVHEVGEWHGQPFIVSEFVHGPTLAAELQSRRPSAREAAQWVAQLADALEYAHACGVVHRDVKPSNVLLREDGRPVLTDFGLAQLLAAETELTRPGDVLGTPTYMAPEQARGDAAATGPLSDVYSLGVVLYEMLAGRRPFAGATTESVLYAVVHEDPAPPRLHDPGVPSALDVVCLHAMAREPARRYTSAAAFAADVRRFLEGRPVLAQPLGPLGRARLWMTRNPALAATVAVAVVAVFVVAAIGVGSVLEERDRLRVQRDEAQANLYRALVSEADALVSSGGMHWKSRALQSLQQAAALPVRARDERELRDLVLRCQTASRPSLSITTRWSVDETEVRAIATRRDRVLWLGRDGIVRASRMDTGAVLAQSLPSDVRRTCLDAAGEGPVVAFGGGAEDADGEAAEDADGSGSNGAVSGVVGLLDVNTLAPVGVGRELASPVRAVALSPDGARLAAGTASGEIHVFALQDDRLVPERVLPGHEGGVTDIEFGPDSTLLASAGEDLVVRTWEIPSGRLAARFGLDDMPRSVAVSPNGSLVAWAEWESLGFGIDASRAPGGGRVRSEGHEQSVRAIAFDADGRVISASADGAVRCSDARGRSITVARSGAGVVRCAAATTDLRGIVTAHRGGAVLVWSISEPEGRRHFRTPHRAVFLGRSTRLITAQATLDLSAPRAEPAEPFGESEVLAVHLGAVRRTVSADGEVRRIDGGRTDTIEGPVTAAAWSADGSRLATLVGAAGARLYAVKGDAAPRLIAQRAGAARAVAVSGEAVAVLAADELAIWNGGAWTAESLPDGEGRGTVGIAGHQVVMSGPRGGLEVRDLRDPERSRNVAAHADVVRTIAVSADGRTVLTIGGDDAARLWDTRAWQSTLIRAWSEQRAGHAVLDATGQLAVGWTAGGVELVDLDADRVVARLWGRGTAIAAFGPDRSVAIGTLQGAVWWWAADTWQAEAARQQIEDAAGRGGTPHFLVPDRSLRPGGHLLQEWGLAASPDGRRLATSSHDGAVKLWDVATLRLERDLLAAGDIAWTTAFSPDGRVVAAGSGTDIVLWDADTGTELRRLEGHAHLVAGLAFHPTRSQLASVEFGGELRIWDLTTGAGRVVHRQRDRLHDVVFSPDGTRLVAASGSGEVLVWEDWSGTDVAPSSRIAGDGAAAWAVTFDSTGAWLAVGTERGIVHLHDAATLELRTSLDGDVRLIRSLAWDASGRYLAAGCYLERSVVFDLHVLRGVLGPMGLDW